MTSAISKLRQTPDVDWRFTPTPIMIMDGEIYEIKKIKEPLQGLSAYVVGLTEKHFNRFCDLVRAQSLHFYDMRVKDLSRLAEFEGLLHLAIRGNTKCSDISFFEMLPQVETLILEDTRHVHDLSPLRSLKKLSAFRFSGDMASMSSKNTAESLEPLALLPSLRELYLSNVRIKSGGLRPLAACKQLAKLGVSNQFPTEDYAFLSVHLPNTDCSRFSPYTELRNPIDGKDVMIVGSRKPSLSSKTDFERIKKYVADFRRLQRSFSEAIE